MTGLGRHPTVAGLCADTWSHARAVTHCALPSPHTDDTFAFWRGLKDAGLLDEVIQEFHQELVETMKGLQQRVQDPPLQLRGEGPPPRRGAAGRAP